MGLANDLISMHSPSSNIINLFQCENITECSLMKLQHEAIVVLNVMILHKHTVLKFHKLYTSKSNR